MNFIAWTIFVASAVLEVGGDALIRRGLRAQSLTAIVTGFVGLGCYGLVVNSVKWDFSKMLGVYVAVFASISVFVGLWIFKENVPVFTWIGLALIVAGGLTIQFGS